eukprot:scpid69015/ scgid32527/ Drebrin-like protein B
MSTSTQFVDQAVFDAALSNVRSGDLKWLLIGHPEGIPDQLELQETGNDVDDLMTMLDDSQMQYALVRMEETIDVSVTIKFVYINWNGNDVGFAVRGRYGVTEGSVREWLSPIHLDIKTSSKEETSFDYIAGEIGRQSGQLSKVREDIDSRQSNAGSTPHRPSATGASKPAPKVSQKGADVGVADNIEDVLSELRNSESEVNAVALHFPENNVKNGLHVLHIGNQGASCLAEFFTEDAAVYALIRVVDIVDEIPTVKFAQIKWVGDKVKPMTKAKIATQTGEIARILGITHVSIMASHRNEVTDRAVMDKVSAASGSKKVVG